MRFFSKIKDIWSHEELRNKIGVTLGLILVYRIGSFIVLPGVTSDVLTEQMSALGSGGLGDILSLFTGGAFTRADFALGIMPYISIYYHPAYEHRCSSCTEDAERDESGRRRLLNTQDY